MAGGPAAFSGVPDTPSSLTAARAATRLRMLVRGCAGALLLGCGGASGPSGPAGAGVVTSVQINTGAATVTVGGTVPLTATARDVNGATVASTVTWSSSAASVATISAAGVATGVSAGTTTITASSAGITAAILLTVTLDDTPASVTLAPPGPIPLVSGGAIAIVPTVRATDGHVVGTATVVFGVLWVLLPYLILASWMVRAKRQRRPPNPALERTPTAGNAGSGCDAHSPQ